MISQRAHFDANAQRPVIVRGFTLTELPAVRPFDKLGIKRQGKCAAFTLTELLVAVAIMLILAGVTVPIVFALSRSIHGQGGLNTIQAAVAAARAYATRTGLNATCESRGGSYSGTAIIFTPGNELRIVENDPDTCFVENKTDVYLESRRRNGYRDIDGRDYLHLQRDMGVVGIWRAGGAANDPPILLAPPFALRFDETGRLIVTDNGSQQDERWVYYNADRDANDRVKLDNALPTPPYGARFGSYDPDAWDPRRSNYTQGVDAEGKAHLPFDRLEAVLGVVLFSRKDFDAATDSGGTALSLQSVGSTPFGISDSARNWLLKTATDGHTINAKIVLFSRYTGSVIGSK